MIEQIEKLKKIHARAVRALNEMPQFARLAAPGLVREAQENVHMLEGVIAELEIINGK